MEDLGSPERYFLWVKMKVCYSSDLHGEIQLYRQLFELVGDSSAEIVALGGDLLPSLRGGRYEHMVAEQSSFIRGFLLPFFERGLKTAHAKHILLIPGNWDVTYPDLFAKAIEGVVDLERKKFQFHGYDWIGYPFVPPTPFLPKDYEKMDDPDAPWPPQKNPSYIRSADSNYSVTPIDPYLFLKQRGTIQEDLNQLVMPDNYRKAIYILHSPPYGTRLDLVRGGQSVGSRSIRHFIETHQPLLTLHGHIHESPDISGDYLDRIGKTISINPGQSMRKPGGIIRLQAVTFEMENPEKAIIHTRFTKRG